MKWAASSRNSINSKANLKYVRSSVLVFFILSFGVGVVGCVAF